MTIQHEILETRFSEFSDFIKTYDKQDILSFKTSKLVDNTENYKYSVYEEARENLGNKFWKTDDIGTGKIQRDVISAIKTRVNHNNQIINNNLVDWRKKDNFSKRSNSTKLETILFDFFKSKIQDQKAFENFLDEKLSYQFIAYLFFIKDKNKFMPISQEKFDIIFEIIGLNDFKTSSNASWENYTTFIDIIKQVRDFLHTKDSSATLLDAHSFLWILGNQMKEIKSNLSGSTFILTSLNDVEKKLQEKDSKQDIVEDDDELAFPEGKEIYNLHKSKERNRELVCKVKDRSLKTNANLPCQICGFSFYDKYGELGKGFIEAHHLFPISQLTNETETKFSDMVLVCSNCHRMLHRKRPWISIDELMDIIK
ncbi:MAG: HNHc protein [Ignavibacteria bacterium]|nr:HNHc protein [Ignavibacteria bacterium]